MQSGITYGAVNNDWAMTFQMNNASARGFWWGDDGHTTAQGAMALSTDGKLTLAHSIRIGYGEADTTVPGATYRLDVSGSGNFTGDVNSSSDIRLKTNIKTLTNSLEKVLSMRGVEFDRIDLEGNPHQIGVIAQEIEEVIPELVSTNENEIKSVSYAKITAVLIEAVKEQQEQIENLYSLINHTENL
jgi:hypothetical protein